MGGKLKQTVFLASRGSVCAGGAVVGLGEGAARVDRGDGDDGMMDGGWKGSFWERPLI